ncbi:MAG: PD40 domain-containing protein [Anaerolineaceae bacterium]|nr:PD40 domain-containing protein [Anaerolineaceae bacterium]
MFSWQLTKRLVVFPLVVLFLLAATGCIPASETDLPTITAPTTIETNEETTTFSPERFGFAIVTVPGGEKRWPMAKSNAEVVLDWSPDGRSLLYSGSPSGSSDLFTLDLEIGEVTQLTSEEWLDSHGSFSPDGSQVAYLSLTNLAQYQHHLFVVDRDGGNPRQLAAAGNNTPPRWSPDGRKIAYEHEQNLMLFDLAANRAMQLVDLAGEQQIVDWATDGTAILFASNHHSPQEAMFGLYQYELVTGEVEPLVENMENIAYADLSPDGRFLAFTSNANSNHVDIYHLYLLDVPTGEIAQLGEREAAHIAWSPGGDWIAISSYEANGDIFIIRPDGSELTRLTDSGEDEWGSIWSPDGTQIAFTSERFVEQALPATAVPSPANFTRIDLPNDLRPRGISDQWYVASKMAESTLYLIEIESGRRFVISENGGWGDVVLTQATVAWIGDEGHVWQYNILTGETQQLTQVPAERFNLAGNERWLVWQDKRNETGDENYYAADIYAFNLVSGEEIPVAVAEGVQQQPALSGDLVVWADNRNSPVRGEPLEGCGNCPDNPFDIYSFNLRTGKRPYSSPTVSTMPNPLSAAIRWPGLPLARASRCWI